MGANWGGLGGLHAMGGILGGGGPEMGGSLGIMFRLIGYPQSWNKRKFHC